MTPDAPGAPAARRRHLLGLAALVAGAGLAFLLPQSWLFVPKAGTAAARPGAQYACPMFCVVMDALPADERCPVCGMKLAEIAGEARVSAEERAMIGLEAAALARRRLATDLRLVGEVDYDESRLQVVSARASGWLEAVAERVAWQDVSAGQALFEIYSPEIYAQQSDYLVARKRGGADLEAARRGLELLGVDAVEIARLEERGEPLRRVAYRAPSDGVIVRRRAIPGLAVKAGEELYAIADLGRVWIQFEAFEDEVGRLAPGLEIRIRRSDADAGFSGRVTFVDPVVDRRSRTARVRVEVLNARREDGTWELLPGQRLTGVAEIPVGEAGSPLAGPGEATPLLALPRSAVLRTGRRTVVYVLFTELREDDGSVTRDYRIDPDRLPPGVGYEMVQVELGPLARRVDSERLEEYYPVRRVVPPPDHVARGGGTREAHALTALEPGFVVATDGAFLLDSQAQLAGRPSLLQPTGRAATPSAGHAGH